MQKINKFFRNYTNPAMWISGGLTLMAILLSRVTKEAGLMINILYIVVFLLAGLPILFRAVQGLRFKGVGIEALVSIAVIGACFIALRNKLLMRSAPI